MGDKTLKIHAAILAAALVFAIGGCGEESAPKVSETKSAAPAAPMATEKATVPSISEDSEKLFQKALSAYGEGNRATALALSKEALEKDAKNYKAYSLCGIIEAFEGNPEQGIASISKALTIHPGYTQAFFDIAMAQKLGGHYDASISYFEKVLAVDPHNTWSYYGIATNYADKKDKAKALTYLSKAMALDREAVRGEALTQDHFAWMREDPDFKKLVEE